VPGLQARSVPQLGSAFGSWKFAVCLPHTLTRAHVGGEGTEASQQCRRGGCPLGSLLLQARGVPGSQAGGMQGAGTPQPWLAQQGSPGTVTQPWPSPANPSSSFQTEACSSAPCHVNMPGEAGGDALWRFTP